MTVYARVVSGVVTEILTPIEGHELAECFPASLLADVVDAPDGTAPGWTYDGKNFASPAAPEPITDVPVSVTSAQAKIQCLRTPGSAEGKTLLDDITAAVQAAGGEAQIWFTEARTWERTNPYVASLSKGLKLKPADVDQLFIAAAQIAA